MLRGTGIVFVTFKYTEGATKCLLDHRLNPPSSKVFIVFYFYAEKK